MAFCCGRLLQSLTLTHSAAVGTGGRQLTKKNITEVYKIISRGSIQRSGSDAHGTAPQQGLHEFRGDVSDLRPRTITESLLFPSLLPSLLGTVTWEGKTLNEVPGCSSNSLMQNKMIVMHKQKAHIPTPFTEKCFKTDG